MVYQGISGMVYDIEEKKFRGGGEGNIHLIRGNDRQVAKIFKIEKRDAQREQKLKLMVQMNKFTEEQLKHITWPQDVIYDQKGFAGYIMPKVTDTSSLTLLYSDENYDLRYKLFSAINLCAAIDDVHAAGQVCGDLNPQNICINLDKNGGDDKFQITLVDVDSYHFTVGNTVYRCEVLVPEYIAPEIQKKLSGRLTLKNVALPTYTRETDLFALAVYIFMLLMNGCHPFACSKDITRQQGNTVHMGAANNGDSVVAPQPVENIRDGFFPFYQTKQGISTPVYAPDFNALPKELQDMFVRAFIEGYHNPLRRPSAMEWQTVLLPYLLKMTQCSKNHYYFNHQNECPFCKINSDIAELFQNMNTPPTFSDSTEAQPQTQVPPTSQTPPMPSTSPPPKRHVEWKVLIAVAAFAMIALVIIFGNIWGTIFETVNEEYSADKQQDQWLIPNPSPAVYAEESEKATDGKRKEENAESQKTKADAEKLEKLNKIISAIKNKNYKKAGTLTEKYCVKYNGFGKIYVQKGKIVDSIKSGTGFMINGNWLFSYRGNFKKGKKHGRGIDVGVDIHGNNYKVRGRYKNNKLNGKAAIYRWNQKVGKRTYNTKTVGTYKNNKENGKFSVKYEYKNGNIFHTFYYRSSHGKRSVIRYTPDAGYVFAQTSNGRFEIGVAKKKWLSEYGHPGYFFL